jgi:DNA-binding NarL/FixJ family response regulator
VGETLRVVIVDDHPVYRQGLARLLSKSGIDVVGEAPNGLVALELVNELAPDVVIMDLNMPQISGVEATRRLTERTPVSRVLVLTVSALEADVTDAILAGASGYVLKDGPIEEVVTAIRATAAGESWISPRVAATLLGVVRERQEVGAEQGVPPVSLSHREIQVLSLLAAGKANPEIGAELVIAPSTVRNHISSILTKLQVDNRVQAAVRAVRDRMV